ncbi:ribosomal RNA processing protein 1 homolog A-like [Anneissia japonica]|uniref:ribosomal RNA processing protein 1 homolog A-like n=1 Tax=Anneissia japonica TaxID=1529436 RepID=UPI001425AD53|nr:ribosomal RNA processing protein 1 homolog A-like [Anneissia japonica]
MLKMSGPKVTVEVHFAQRLASNEKTIRDKTIKKLRLWMSVRSKSGNHVFTEEDLLKLWKGLYYCMWMCDKPLVQEELADNIAKLVHKLHTTESALMYFKSFLQTMEREWHGIDRLRMDKYYMFIRRMFCEQLEFLKENQWNGESVGAFLEILKQGPLNAAKPTKATGLLHHITDIYLDELTRVGATQLSPQETLIFIDPFCIFVAQSKNKSLMKTILREIFEDIMVQSTVGMEEVLEAEKKMAKKKKKENNEEDDDEEDESEEEDPRLAFDYSAVADRLFMLGSQKDTPGLNRKKMYGMAQKFQDLAKGIYPIPDLEELTQLSSDDEIVDDVKLKHKKKQKKKMQEAKIRREMEREEEKNDAKINSEKPTKKEKEGVAVTNQDAYERTVNGDIHRKTKKKKKKGSKMEDEIQDCSSKEIVSLVDASTMSKKSKKLKKSEKLKVTTHDTNNVEIVIIDTDTDNKKKVKKNKKCGEEQETNGETTVMEKGDSEFNHLDDNSLQNLKMQKKKTKTSKRKSESGIEQQTEVGNLGEEQEVNLKRTVMETQVESNNSEANSLENIKTQKKKAKKTTKRKSETALVQQMEEPFAAFQTVSTPPAVVLKKRREPQTEIRKKVKKSKLMAPGSAPAATKKHVKITLSKNTNYKQSDYRKQILCSPGIPFDSTKKPAHSVLKKTPTSAPKAKLAFKKRRSTAVDFF